MTEKRFKNVEENLEWGTVQYFTYYDEKITDEELEKLVNHLLKENKQLKQFIQSLAEQSVNGKVMLRDGKVYDLNEILKKGDVE